MTVTEVPETGELYKLGVCKVARGRGDGCVGAREEGREVRLQGRELVR
jgi:hypothetical protein